MATRSDDVILKRLPNSLGMVGIVLESDVEPLWSGPMRLDEARATATDLAEETGGALHERPFDTDIR